METEARLLAEKNAGERDDESIRNNLEKELHIAEIDKQIRGIVESIRGMPQAEAEDNAAEDNN
jgi:hypothetical protein